MRWLAAVLVLAVLTATVACDGDGESLPRDHEVDEAEASALLKQDLAAARRPSFSVEYELVGFEGNTLPVTWHRDADGNPRFDVGEAGELVSVFLTDGVDGELICAEDARSVLDPVPASVVGGVCSPNPTADTAWLIILVPFGFGFDDFAQEASVTRVTERNIAGQRARCYTFASPDGGTSCLADRILLAAFAEDGAGSATIEAVEVRTPADAAAFELPYPLVNPEE